MLLQEIIEKNGETIMVLTTTDYWHLAYSVLYIIGVILFLIFFYFVFYIVYKLYKRAKHW